MKRKETLAFFNKSMQGKKRSVVLLLLLQILLGVSGILYAWLLRQVIDKAVAQEESAFWTAISCFIALVIGQIAVRALLRFLEEWIRSGLENNLKERLFKQLLCREYHAVKELHSEEWLTRLTNDTVVVADGIVTIVPGLVGMLTRLLGATSLLVVLAPWLFSIFLPLGLALLLFTFCFRKVLKRLHRQIQEADGKVRVFLQEHLSSLIIVKSFLAEDFVQEEAKNCMKEHRMARIKRNHVSNLCNIGFGVVMHGIYIIGVAGCGYGILKGLVSYGTLMAVLQLIGQLQAPLANVTGYVPKYYAMVSSMERLIEAEQFSIDKKEEALSSEQIREFYENEFLALEFQNVSFRYPKEEKEVLPSVSMKISKGEFVAFAGRSGCGKSTCLKLLLGLYPILDGELYFDLVKQNKKITGAYRRLFAYVPQGNYLMKGKIRDIVTFGQDKQEIEKIYHALKLACAEFVFELPNGIDTELGEHGAGLSEGQLQRISIARAFYMNSPIFLLDEATSALDEQTERQLLWNLRNFTDKTVILVTHRQLAIEACDRVIRW